MKELEDLEEFEVSLDNRLLSEDYDNVRYDENIDEYYDGEDEDYYNETSQFGY